MASPLISTSTSFNHKPSLSTTFFISPPNFDEEEDLDPTTRALLCPNSTFLGCTSRGKSPYEISDIPFADLLEQVPARTMPVSPRSSSPDRKSRNQISIFNYNPNKKQPFTDSLTIKAIQNLSISWEDLFFPTSEELDRIGGDRVFYRERLTERAIHFAQLVKDERNRLRKSEMDDNNSLDSFPMVNSKRSKSENPTQSRSNIFVPNNPKDAIIRARMIEAKKISKKRIEIEESEIRHQKRLQEIEQEKNIEMTQFKEHFKQKRKRHEVLNQQLKHEQMKRIAAIEIAAAEDRERLKQFEEMKRTRSTLARIGTATQSQRYSPNTNQGRRLSPTYNDDDNVTQSSMFVIGIPNDQFHIL